MMPEDTVEPVSANSHTDNGTVTGEAASAPVSKKPVDEEWYTLKDIAPMLAVGYDRLRGFAEADGVRDLLVTMKSPIGRGLIYGADSVKMFRAMIRGQDEGRITPKTAAAFLKMILEGGEGIGPLGQSASSALSPVSGAALVAPTQTLSVKIDLTPSAVLDAIRDGQEAGAQRAIKEQSERWYSLKDAHDEFGVSIGALSKLSFKEGGRRKVRKSDVLAYMRRFTEQLPGERAIGPTDH